MMVPDVLCHYYDAAAGPFRTLSEMPAAEAEMIMDRIRQEGALFASKRASDYLDIRKVLEKKIRSLFMEKGGRPLREWPYSMTLGPCAWLLEWYPDGREIRIPLASFDLHAVSFTYGDTFPAMRYPDGKPTRGNVYTFEELPDLIHRFGLPQATNPGGLLGPDRYIEAQVWQEIPPWQAIAQD